MTNTTVELERSPQACVLTSGDFRLGFYLSQDRWEQRLEIRAEGEWRPILCSVEGTPSCSAPPSPAFQDLHAEAFPPDVAEVQLMGLSGKAAYSAAVRYDGRAGSLEFDVAVRVSAPQTALQPISTYRCGSATLEIHELGQALISLEGRRLRIEPLTVPGHPPVTCRRDAGGNAADGPRLSVGCSDLSGVAWDRRGTTLRWGYRIWVQGHS